MAGEGLHPFGVTALAEYVIVERIATAPFRFGRQHQPAVLALVAVDVEAAIERHHAHRFVLARTGHNRQLADAAAGRKLFVEIIDTVYLVRGVHRERDAVQRFATDDAREALRMVRFARGTENTLQDRFQADGTLFQRVQIVLLAVRFPVQSVERFALQIDLTLVARKASDVINLVHRGTARLFADDTLAALYARTERFLVLYRLYQQIGERVHFGTLGHRVTAMAPVLLLRGARYDAIIRTVDTVRINVRRVQRVVRSSRHLTRRAWIDRLIDRLVRGRTLRTHAVRTVQ